MKDIPTISGNFDPGRRARLKKAYDIAVKNNLEEFTFEGMILLTKYTKYLLEYVDMELAKPTERRPDL